MRHGQERQCSSQAMKRWWREERKGDREAKRWQEDAV